MWAHSSAVLPNAALSSAATVASSAPAKAGAESDGGVAAAKSWTRSANATTNAVTGERFQPLPVERRLLAFRPRLFMAGILCRGAAQRQDRGARDEREDRRKGREAWKVRGNPAPMRRDHLIGVEGLVAIAAEDQRGIVAQHFELDLAHERVDGAPIPSRHLPQMHEERLGAGEVGMRAFVERARLVGQAPRNHAPKTGELPEVHEVLEPPHRQVGRVLPFRELPDRREIGGDDLHLPVGEARDRNPPGRRGPADLTRSVRWRMLSIRWFP